MTALHGAVVRCVCGGGHVRARVWWWCWWWWCGLGGGGLVFAGSPYFARYDGGMDVVVDEANGVSPRVVGTAISSTTIMMSVRWAGWCSGRLCVSVLHARAFRLQALVRPFALPNPLASWTHGMRPYPLHAPPPFRIPCRDSPRTCVLLATAVCAGGNRWPQTLRACRRACRTS
jgi:hypothetical protein